MTAGPFEIVGAAEGDGECDGDQDVLVLLDPGDDNDVVANFSLSFASELGAHLTAAGLVLELVPPASFVGDFPEDLIVAGGGAGPSESG